MRKQDPEIILITGGSRSGKSRFALEKSSAYERKVFLATAVITDDEMKGRIAAHRRERGSQFITVEEPIHIARAIQTYSPHSDAILIDCLTFWVNNLLHHLGDNHSLITEEIEGFLKIIEDRPTSLIIVTNETTMGIVPADPLTRQFTEWQGRLNQEVAKRADEVIFMVSGLPQVLKSSSHESHIKAH